MESALFFLIEPYHRNKGSLICLLLWGPLGLQKDPQVFEFKGCWWLYMTLPTGKLHVLFTYKSFRLYNNDVFINVRTNKNILWTYRLFPPSDTFPRWGKIKKSNNHWCIKELLWQSGNTGEFWTGRLSVQNHAYAHIFKAQSYFVHFEFGILFMLQPFEII